MMRWPSGKTGVGMRMRGMNGIAVTRRPGKLSRRPFRRPISQYSIDAAHRGSCGISADT